MTARMTPRVARLVRAATLVAAPRGPGAETRVAALEQRMRAVAWTLTREEAAVYQAAVARLRVTTAAP